MHTQVIIISFLNLLLIAGNKSARILVVIPSPCISHQVVFRPLTQELAKKGHEVTVLTTDPAFPKGQTPENLTEIDLHDISYPYKRKTLNSLNTTVSNAGVYETAKIVKMTLFNMFETQLRNDEVKRLIEEINSFDLLLIEGLVQPAFFLSHGFKGPVVLMNSYGGMTESYNMVGSSSQPVLYPGLFRKKLYNLSLWDKLKALLEYVVIKRLDKEVLELSDEMFKIHFPDASKLKEIISKVHMLFLNAHSIWEGNRPVPPGVIYLPELRSTKTKKPLPKELKSYLDSSENGVIYISFGTSMDVSQMLKDKIDIILNVLSKLPYDILLKWDKDELPGKPKNVRIGKWFPQPELLKHKKTILFITQGGKQSIDEAIKAGVPMIGIPLFMDQFYNTEKIVHYKLGLKLKLNDISEDLFRNTITTVIEDESYRRSVVTFYGFVMDQRESSVERAVWWTNYILRHGDVAHLRSPAANMPMTEYFELELAMVVILMLVTSIIIFTYAIYVVMKCLKKRYRKGYDNDSKLK